MKKDWYKDWFSSEDYLDVYKHRDEEDTDKLVNLILANVEIPSSAKILDAACGAGRHAIRFAELGYLVTGFDLSGTLLTYAKLEARNKSLDINFIQSDIRTFRSEIKFDLITNLFTSFGYFDSDEENFLFVTNAYEFLNKNGYYILDYLNKDYLEANLVSSSEKIIDGKEIHEKRSISDDRVIKHIKVYKNNGNNEFLESVKLYSFDELEQQFNKIGFSTVKVFGDYEGSNYNREMSERCIIIFRK